LCDDNVRLIGIALIREPPSGQPLLQPLIELIELLGPLRNCRDEQYNIVKF